MAQDTSHQQGRGDRIMRETGAPGARISEILFVPENDRLEIELCGDLAGILALTSGSAKPVSG
jgi:hypothetical protein